MAHEMKSDRSSENGMNGAGSTEMVVPVDPLLCNAFQNLQLINQYRVTGDTLLLDQLMQNVECPDDGQIQGSSDAYDSQQDCYEGEESDEESETMMQKDIDHAAFNLYLRREPLQKITEEE